jgi:hypothetical protein
MNNPYEATHHHFQFISACIEKAIQLGYEYDQEKSLQVIHEEAKEYIQAVDNDCDSWLRLYGTYDESTNTLSFEVNGSKQTISTQFETDEIGCVFWYGITEDGQIYHVVASNSDEE